MKQKIVLLVLVLACGVFTGCGGAKVTGKVTFDDGSPLTVGTVNFESGNELMIGHIKPDGTYLLVGSGKSSGIPQGSYKVFISNATEDTDKVHASLHAMVQTDRKVQRELVASKFLSPTTSGLTCDVKGTTTYDIKVSKP